MRVTPKRRARRGEQTLVTIHGIRTDGAWQENFEAIFGPHFHYESFKYPHFQHPFLAIFWLALEPIVLLLVAGCLGLGLYSGRIGTDGLSLTLCVLGAATLVLIAGQIAEERRNAVISEFTEFCAEATNGRPHVIAHSLGSFVLGRAMLRYEALRVRKVVLVGCVLQSRFGWSGVLPQFELIRNELGSKDWVTTAAQLLGPFVEELGAAGRTGFAATSQPGGPRVVKLKPQQAGDPWRECACGKCTSIPADIVNVDGKHIHHNDLTEVSIRARRRWLPYFWDIPPGHYERFVDLCEECDRLESSLSVGDQGEPATNEALADKFGELLVTCWFWSKGPLEQFLLRFLAPLTANPEAKVKPVAAKLFRMVAAAGRTETNGGMRWLFPHVAVRDAVVASLKERG